MQSIQKLTIGRENIKMEQSGFLKGGVKLLDVYVDQKLLN